MEAKQDLSKHNLADAIVRFRAPVCPSCNIVLPHHITQWRELRVSNFLCVLEGTQALPFPPDSKTNNNDKQS